MAAPGAQLAARVVAGLAARGQTLAVAESVTGGLVAGRLTDVPGASDVLVGGVVAYTLEAKAALLGITRDTVDEHGVVSDAVARAMAEGVRSRLATTWGLATTGHAGPTGGTAEAPVGTVWVGLAGPQATAVERLSLHGERAAVRAEAVTEALAMLVEAFEPAPTDP